MAYDHIKGLKACCPKCKCEPEKIIYRNSGPIVTLHCPNCLFRISDGDFEEDKWTFQGLINHWNKIGIQEDADV